jgi:hypothetical protein
MSSPEHEFQIEALTDEQLKQSRLELQGELAVCAQNLSDANKIWYRVLERIMLSNVELAARGIAATSFLPEVSMPESLAGPTVPALRIVQ